MVREDGSECKEILQNYFEIIDTAISEYNGSILSLNDPYNGKIQILWENNYIIGITNLDDSILSEKYILSFKKLLKNNLNTEL